MDIFDLISFYYHMFIAAIFRQKQCEEYTKKALRYDKFMQFQTTDNRNALWMEMSLRERNILIEFIIQSTIGISHPRLQHVFYNIMHSEAENNRLQSIFDVK